MPSTSTNDCVDLRFVVANKMSEVPFGRFDFDGILGLGFDSLSMAPQFSFFGQMMLQFPLMKPLFAVFLARTDEDQSAISFGGYDEKCAASEPKYASVAFPELGHWMVQIKQVRIGDTVLEDCEDGNCRAIVDTGSNLLGVPR